jgi:hypothetical protein
MYKTINKCTPVYLQEMFSRSESVYNQIDSEGKLYIPKPVKDYLKRSFIDSGDFYGIDLRISEIITALRMGLQTFFNNRSASHTVVR